MGALIGRWSEAFPRHDCEQLFAVAVDVESYPRFLPWCRHARVLRRDGAVLTVANRFGAGPLHLSFDTRAEAEPPHRLEITATQPPFRSFRLEWIFSPLPGGGARARAEYRVDLRSPLLQSLARLSLPDIERRVLRAFHDRVVAVYGESGRDEAEGGALPQ